MRKLRAFTLVELLVVIGIIAVLISILLPSLARARQSALTIQCAANLRTIGQALQMYANDNKGFFPYGWAQSQPAQGLNNDLMWYSTLANTLGAPTNNAWDTATNTSMKYFQCPEVNITPAAPWTPIANYGGHPIVFGSFQWTTSILGVDAAGNGIWPGERTPYKQVWLARNGAEKCIVWDATVRTDPNNNAGWTFPASGNVNGDQYWWGTYLVDEPGVWNGWTGRPGTFGDNQASLNGAFADIPGNRDGGGDMDTYRFRHMGNSACNFLFGDGHVETRHAQRQGESLINGTTDLTNNNFCAPYPVPGLVAQ